MLDILLGLHYDTLMSALKTREGANPEQPLALKTRLGWVVCEVSNPRWNQRATTILV